MKALPGPCTAAMMAVVRDVADDRALAELICQVCMRELNMDGAALSLLTASVARHTLHATDPTAELLEELQFSLNEGACMEAARTGGAVLVADLLDSAEGGHWPIFAAAVTEQTAVRAIFALPLQWGTVSLGVLDLYRRAPGGLTDDQRRDVLAAVDIASLMMLTLRTDPAEFTGGNGRATPPEGWLEPMVAGRVEIHQATGMVLAQLDVDAETALARMRAHAFVEQRLLIDVAHDVVARTLVFTDTLDDQGDVEGVRP